MSISKGWLGLYLWMDEKRQEELEEICMSNELQQSHPLKSCPSANKEAKIVRLPKASNYKAKYRS